MTLFGATDWATVFLPTVPLAEIVVRGTVMYLALFVALRFFLKRSTGQVGIADLLVVVVISELAQNAFVGEAQSIPDALLGIAVILFWAFAVNWLSFHVPAVGRLMDGQPMPLVEDGRLCRENMRRELVTYDELMAQLRQTGVDDLGQVKLANLEADGTFSVVRNDGGDVESRPEHKAA